MIFKNLRPDLSTPAKAARTLERLAKLVREKEVFAASFEFDGGRSNSSESAFGFSNAQPPTMKIELYGRVDALKTKPRKKS